MRSDAHRIFLGNTFARGAGRTSRPLVCAIAWLLSGATTASPDWSGVWSVNFSLGDGLCMLQDGQYSEGGVEATNLHPAMLTFAQVAPSKRDAWPLATDTEPHELLLLFRFPYVDDLTGPVTSVRIDGTTSEPGQRSDEENGIWFRVREPKSREIFDKLESQRAVTMTAFDGDGAPHDLGVLSLERFHVAAEMFAACGRSIGT